MKKIVFMFGAGAEIGFGLPTGNEFMKQTLFAKKSYKPEEISYVQNHFINDHNFKKKVVCNLLMQLFNQDFLLDNRKNYEDLNDVEQDKISTMYLLHKSYVEENLESLNVVIEEKGKFYSEEKRNVDNSEAESSGKKLITLLNKYLLQDNIKEKNEQKGDELDEDFWGFLTKLENNEIKISAIGIEKHFMSINDPMKYGRKNYSKIVNLYWAIYYSITNACLEFLGKDLLGEVYGIKDILEKNKEIWCRDFITKVEKKNKDNYYTSLNNYEKMHETYSLSAITTNYTPYVSLMFDHDEDLDIVDNDKIAYLNGRLDMFENFDELSIKSCLCDDESIEDYMSNAFPFLMPQCMIKPIIHPYQIKEYHKAATWLEEADYLVILGYGLNEDDNHVNALLNSIDKKCKVILCEANKDKVKDKDEDEDEDKKSKKDKCFKNNEKILVYYRNEENGSRSCDEIIEEIFKIVDRE